MNNRPDKGVLLRQATFRVVLITLLMVATSAILVMGFQNLAMNNSARKVMRSLANFYTEKMVLWEQEWQETAIAMHNRLELQNLFEVPDLAWQRLEQILDQEVTTLFAVMIVTDATQQILFKRATSPVNFPKRFATPKQSGWFEEQSNKIIYYWIAQPLWLGSRGHGQLILFVPVENGLLFRNALPFTDLYLLHDDHIHASSLGNIQSYDNEWHDGVFWDGNNRIDQLTLPWSNLTNHAIKLIIRHHSHPFFSLREIVQAAILMLGLFALIFWRTLGVWLVALTRRITMLGWVAREFAQGSPLSPKIRDFLIQASQPDNDEVAAVAMAMTQAKEAQEVELLARKTAQEHLQMISNHNKLLLEAAGEGIFGVDPDGRATFINPAGARMLGWNPDELIGQLIHDYIHHSHGDHTPLPQNECHILDAFRENKILHIPMDAFWRKDVSSFPVECTSTPIVQEGIIVGAVVVFRDITERMQAEQQAAHYMTYQRMVNGLYEISYLRIPLQEQLDKALDFIFSVPWLAIQAEGAVFLADPTNNRLLLIAHKGLHPELVNRCQFVPYGYCLCGRAAMSKSIIHARDVDARHDIIFEGMSPHGHYSVPLLSGEQLLGVLTLYLEPGQANKPEQESLIQAIGNTLGSMIERKNLEESLQHQNLFLEEKVLERTSELQNHLASLKKAQNQLIQSERMAALGGLVAGISHEIKTPVGIGYTAITYLETETTRFTSSYQQGSLRREELDHYLNNVTEATHLIKANLQRASDLILSFKQVAVDQTSQEKRVFNLKVYLEETVFTLRPKLKKTQHRVVIDCPESIELNSYPGALSQILSNWIINSLNYAFDAHDSGEIRIQAGFLNESMLFLNYQDNGKGMDKETLKQIYEPFFTTNRNQGGSGLGMHIVYNLVTQRLNGTIECISSPGQGTQFRIQFPV